MKIRYYQKLDKGRWIGFLLALTSVFILSNANVSTQWLGWSLGCLSCAMWVYFGLKDKDIPRTLMELCYLLLGLRAVYNWLLQ